MYAFLDFNADDFSDGTLAHGPLPIKAATQPMVRGVSNFKRR